MGSCLLNRKIKKSCRVIDSSIVKSGSAYSVSYVWDSGVSPTKGIVSASVLNDSAYAYTVYLDGSIDNSTWTNNLATFTNAASAGSTKQVSYSGYRYFRIRGTNSAGAGGPQYIQFTWTITEGSTWTATQVTSSSQTETNTFTLTTIPGDIYAISAVGNVYNYNGDYSNSDLPSITNASVIINNRINHKTNQGSTVGCNILIFKATSTSSVWTWTIYSSGRKWYSWIAYRLY